MIKRKLVGSLLCFAMLTGMLTGCKETSSTTSGTSTEGSSSGDIKIEIVSKGFQHQYWQAVLKGANQKAKELGVTINFVGPNSESDIADQVQMLNSAINAKPAAIGLEVIRKF